MKKKFLRKIILSFTIMGIICISLILLMDTKTDLSNTDYEMMFKNGIRIALQSVTNIDTISETDGKPIVYFRISGPKKWEKLTSTEMNAQKLPPMINVFPRSQDIDGSIPDMVFQLWERYFSIQPILGEIRGVEMNNDFLVIKSTVQDKKYDKKERVPDQMYRLWRDWAKVNFPLSSVKELTPAQFDTWKRVHTIK